MKNIKVLNLIDELNLGGTESAMVRLVSSINQEQYKMIVCSFDDGILKNELVKRGIETYIIKKRIPFDIVALIRLCILIIRKRIDFIHARLLRATIYGCLASIITQRPILYSLHGSLIFDLKRGKLTNKFAVRHCHKIVTVSNSLKDELENISGVKSNKIEIIYNGIDPDLFKNNNDYDFRKEFQFPEKTFLIGTVGSLRPVKGYNILLKALALVLKTNQNCFLAIIGDGNEKSKLIKLAEELGVQGNVIFTGRRNDVPNILKSFDAYCCSSFTEGISNAILEAMAAAKPIIATNVGGNIEVIKDYECGILVQAHDAHDLSKSITYLLNNPSESIRMGNNAHIRVKKYFNQKEMIKKYEKIYDRIFTEVNEKNV